jgi:uncharacterized protein (DUF1697 family)
MPRHAAFLRGISPTHAKMPEIAACFEAAGFSDAKTVLSSGNVVFSAARGSEASLAAAVERTMTKRLGRSFLTIVRSIENLQALLDRDPFADLQIPAGAKRVVTFLRESTKPTQPLPIERDGANIWCVEGLEVFTSYTPTPRGPVFMEMLKRTFGEGQTTRTWDTIGKVVKAAAGTSSAVTKARSGRKR